MTRLSIWLVLGIFLVLGRSLVGQEPSAPQATSPPHLVLIIAENEYHTDQTLPPFAAANLAHDFRLTILRADEATAYHIPGLAALRTADVLLLSMRRRPLPSDELGAIREFLARGKPLIALRTSSHAFCLRNEPLPAGLAEWPAFDQEILGCHYQNHYGNTLKTYVQAVPAAAEHPILKGVRRDEFPVFGSLYQSAPLAASATLLMTGRAENIEPHEPVAWIYQTPQGGRVFYTSLGHPQDFTLPSFVQLLRNGIYWSAGLSVPAAEAKVSEQVPPR